MLYNYTKGLLGSVQRTANRNGVNISQTYSLTYDAFGNMTGISVGSKALASYEYEDYRLLKKQTYGNGQAVSFAYDEYDRVKTATYPDGRTVTYSYIGDGNVFSIVETGGDSPAAYIYDYDSMGRLLAVWQREQLGTMGTTTQFYSQDYDSNDRISTQSWQFGDGTTYSTNYTYNDNGTLKNYCNSFFGLGYSYDNLLRLTSVVSSHTVAARNYTYRDIAACAKTTMQVAQLAYPNLKGGYHLRMATTAWATSPAMPSLSQQYQVQ